MGKQSKIGAFCARWNWLISSIVVGFAGCVLLLSANEYAHAGTSVSSLNSFSAAPDVMLRCETANGVSSGINYGTGSWVQACTNTVARNNNSIASLSSNRFTLPAGTYMMEGGYVGGANNNTTGCLGAFYNFTDSTYPIEGGISDGHNVNGGNYNADYKIATGIVTITASKTFEMRVFCSGSTNGGYAISSGQRELYTYTNIWKIG
jgi:hypothetical protein